MANPHNTSEAATSSVTAETDPVARVGTIVRGKWRIDSLVGSGGMAAVYAATHRNGQRAALKILHLALAHDDSIRERFLREGYVANSVNHPACVAVLDDDVTEEMAPFLVMELLEGETLSQLWNRLERRLPVAQALQLADPVLDCLAACHTAGVIHRDLKPPNIFITHSGTVKVLDFGVAQLRSAAAEKTRAGTALGTPHYMSPEQAMGLVDHLDGRTDIFSVGAILHALVTGKRIHTARTENEALILAATTPVPSVARIAPDLPVEVIALIDKALAWDRRNRFSDALEMQAAVREALSHVTGASVSVVTPPAQAPASTMAPIIEQVAAAPIASPSPQPAENLAALEELAAEDDPRVVQARELFKHLDRLFPNVRQMGWAHPATERALRTAFEAFAQALSQDENALALSLRPYSFVYLGQTVWEPTAPFDSVPYNLFACGLRSVRFRPGITLDEFRQVLTVLLLDPGRDLPPEDDLATAFWDLGLVHFDYETTDAFAQGGAGEREVFFNEADELERAAQNAATAKTSRLEAQAMALSTDRSALLAQGGATPMAIEDAARRVLAAQLELSRDQWSERYIEVLVEGLLHTNAQGDAGLMLSSLRKSCSDLVVAGRLDVALTVYNALNGRLRQRAGQLQAEQLSARLADAMFSGDTLTLILGRLSTDAEPIEAFAPVLDALSSHELPTVLHTLQNMVPEALRSLLLRFVERTTLGAETELAEAIPNLDPLAVYPMLALLKRLGTPAARKVLSDLGRSPNVAVRIEATILTADTPETVQLELGKLCSDPTSSVRMAALRAIGRHLVKRALPLVMRQVQSASFGTISGEERRELLTTLMTLSPDRGEAVALEIAKKSGLFTSESREVSRVAAIEALGFASQSKEVVAALREIAQSRWGTSEDTRSKAYSAAIQIEARLSSTTQNQGASA